MAIGIDLPPWLNIGPTDYLRAVQAGGSAGLGIAEAQNRAREAAARMAEAQRAAAQRQWEFNENMRQDAERRAADRELEATRLGQTGEYQRGLLDWHKNTLGETIAHNMEMEEIASEKAGKLLDEGEASLTRLPEAPNELFIRKKDGELVHVSQPRTGITPGQALNIITDPLGYNFAKKALGTDATNLVNIARGGLLSRQTPQAGTSQKEVLKPLKNGRMAYFNPDTKEFIRYAD